MLPQGYLLFNRAGTLLAQPFDADRLELKGDAIPIAEGIQFNAANGKAAVAVSANGVLAYRLVPTAAQNKLVWVDRKGAEQPLAAPPHAYRNPRLSPDGQRVAVTIDELGTQEWLLDTKRGTLTRLTFEGSYNGALAWTPDGKRVAFGSDRAGPRNLFWQLADGSGGTERLATSDRSASCKFLVSRRTDAGLRANRPRYWFRPIGLPARGPKSAAISANTVQRNRP